MKKTIITILFTIFIAVVSASAQTEYCFENKGLKGSTMITFAVSGNKVIDGEYSYSEYDSDSSADTLHFTGTKVGKNLNIKFTRTVPEVFKKVGKLIWTLEPKKLTVKMYGKNHNTNKWSIYSAIFEKCSE